MARKKRSAAAAANDTDRDCSRPRIEPTDAGPLDTAQSSAPRQLPVVRQLATRPTSTTQPLAESPSTGQPSTADQLRDAAQLSTAAEAPTQGTVQPPSGTSQQDGGLDDWTVEEQPASMVNQAVYTPTPNEPSTSTRPTRNAAQASTLVPQPGLTQPTTNQTHSANQTQTVSDRPGQSDPENESRRQAANEWAKNYLADHTGNPINKRY